MDQNLFEELNKWSLHDLWRLSSKINRMLEDPRKIKEIRRWLRPGKEIVYFEAKENREITAMIVEVRRTHALVKNKHDEELWNIPFYMIKMPDSNPSDWFRGHGKVERLSFQVGDQVGFLDRSNREIYGTVAKLNPKSAEVRLSTGDRWRVHYHALFQVLEGSSMSDSDLIEVQGVSIEEKVSPDNLV